MAIVAGAVALTPLEPPRAHAGSGGAAVAGAAAGFVMGVIVGRATSNKSTSTRSSSSSGKRTYSRSSSTRYARDDATIQQALNAFGHDAGRPDGVFGPKTQTAIKNYQASIGEEPTGQLTVQQRAQLLADYAALVNRKNTDGGGGTGSDGKGDGSGTTATKTASADDFLKRLREQGGASKDDAAADTADGKSAEDGQDAGTTLVAFDEICSRFEQQQPEARVIDVNLKSGPTRSDSLLLEQLCTARSYALQNLEADLAALGDLDIAEASDQCNAFTATQTESLATIGTNPPDETVTGFGQIFGEVGDQQDAIVRSTRVCLGLAYAFDNPEGAIVTAASLAALGEAGYGELIGEHLATGLGVDRNGPLAADWMEWTAAAIDEGAKPVVDVEGYDRAPLLRVLAEVADDTAANQTADSRTSTKRGGLLLPGMQPSTQEADAVAFFAAESVAMIKSLETLLLAVGLDRDGLQAACSGVQDGNEPLSVRVCRAHAYAARDFEAMYRYDQLLAEADDEDARTRLTLYDALSEQGIAKLVATGN